MTAFELRLLAYMALAVLLFGGGAALDHHFTAAHYKAAIVVDSAARHEALEEAQRKVIAADQAYKALDQQAEKRYVDLKSDYDSLSQRLADSVRDYTALLTSPVPTAPASAPKSDGSTPGPGGDRDLAEAAGRAAEACYHDAAELSALQTWAAGVK